MAKFFFSLGSSLGNRKEILNSAIAHINNKIGTVLAISKIYETEPWGFMDENLFYNMALMVEADLHPEKVLSITQEIEKKHNRQKTKTYQARTLDIDIIFWDDKIYYSEDLQIPHKLAHKRQFVLQPMLDIAPKMKHPLLKKTIKQLSEECVDEIIPTEI